MAAYARYQIECGNSNYGSTNRAIMDVTSASTSADEAVVVAQLCAFAAYCNMGAASSVTGIRKAIGGSAGSTPLAWSQDEYDALRAEDDGLPALTGFAQEIGSGAIGPLGVSATLNLYSTTPGRKTTGRIYTPFLKAAAVGGDGLTTSGVRANIIQGWQWYVKGTGGNPAAISLLPVVHSGITDTNATLVTPTVSALPSRLKTRTR